MSVNTAVTPQGNIVFITKNLVIRLRLRPIRHYWWKEEGPGEDFLCPWSEEEDGDEDKEQEGWELVCRPLYSVIAAIASCWANRTPESQHGRFSVKLTAHWKPERPVWKQLVSKRYHTTTVQYITRQSSSVETVLKYSVNPCIHIVKSTRYTCLFSTFLRLVRV